MKNKNFDQILTKVVEVAELIEKEVIMPVVEADIEDKLINKTEVSIGEQLDRHQLISYSLDAFEGLKGLAMYLIMDAKEREQYCSEAREEVMKQDGVDMLEAFKLDNSSRMLKHIKNKIELSAVKHSKGI